MAPKGDDARSPERERPRSEPTATAAPLAVTNHHGTRFAPGWRGRSDANLIAAHEAVHRGQFANRGRRPEGHRRALEQEAHRGALTLTAGGRFAPVLAAPSGMSLAYTPLEGVEWMPDMQRQVQRETDALATAGLGGEGSRVEAEVSSNDDDGGGHDIHYRLHTTGSGPDGNVDVTTEILVHHNPDAMVSITHGPMLRPSVDPELGWYNSDDVPAYPWVVRYRRQLRYRDNSGRAAVLDLDGVVYFNEHQMDWQLWGVGPPSFDTVLGLIGDEGHIAAHLYGHGSKADVAADYFGQETTVRSQLDAARTHLGAGTRHLVQLPPELLSLTAPAGLQFQELRAWLVASDAYAMFDPVDDWAGSGNTASRDANYEADDGLLSGFLSGVETFWSGLPAWARGTLKAVATFAGMMVLMAAVAGVIVLAAKAGIALGILGAGAAISFGTAMLIVGAVALVGGHLYNVYRRFMEWWEHGGVLGFFAIGFVAFLDTIGVGGIIEAATDESLLTGRELKRNEEQRWEAGTTGVLQLVGIILSVRGLRGRPGEPVVAEVQTRGSMADFHALPAERLPTNLPEGYYWQRRAGTTWELMREPGAPPVEVQISVYADGNGRVNYNTAVEGLPVHSDAMVRPAGEASPGGHRLPPNLRESGAANPMRDPVTGRVYDKGHGVDYVDRTAGPFNSNLDPINFTPQVGWWNSGTRNPLVAAIRTRGGGYREMPVFDAMPPRTVPTPQHPNGIAIPREFVFVETNSSGVPVRAWRIPNDFAITKNAHYEAFLPQFAIPLRQIPQIMRGPTGAMTPPGTRFGRVVITGEHGAFDDVWNSQQPPRGRIDDSSDTAVEPLLDPVRD